jgi:hypothetical protein
MLLQEVGMVVPAGGAEASDVLIKCVAGVVRSTLTHHGPERVGGRFVGGHHLGRPLLDERLAVTGQGRVAWGDTDFTQTGDLDRWDADGVEFIFGIDLMPNLVEITNSLPPSGWKRLVRQPKYEVRTQVRARTENVKDRIVKERQFENTRLFSEMVAQFDYRPGKCRKPYRIVALCKNLTVEKGEQLLFDDLRYFFYITNDWAKAAEEIVPAANGRCNQENLIEQLKNGARAMEMPTGDLVSNWAYVVMASLAWTLKAWFALVLPEEGRRREKYKTQKDSLLKMEFKKFLNTLMRVPCRIAYRLPGWNPWQEVLVRGVDALGHSIAPTTRPVMRC